MPDDDDIPMHHKPGDAFQFPWEGQMLMGVVKEAGARGAVVLAAHDHFWAQGQSISLLTDDKLCPACGRFICRPSECPSRTPNPFDSTNTMNSSTNGKPMTVGELLAMPAGDKQNASWVNYPFEGTVTAIRAGRDNPKTGKRSPDELTLADPADHRVAITVTLFGRDGSAFDGRTIRVSGKGISRGEYKGKPQVSVGDKAEIEILGSAQQAPQNASEPPRASGQPQEPKSSSTGSGIAAKGNRLPTMKMVIYDCMRALSIVNRAYLAMKEEYGLPELSATDLREMATSARIAIARGETIPEWAWEKPKPAQSAEKQGDWNPAPENDWRAYVHDGVTLAEANPTALREWCAWAMDPKSANAKEESATLRKALLECAKENKWTIQSILLHLLHGSTEFQSGAFTQETITKVMGERINDAAAFHMVSHLKETIDGLVTDHASDEDQLIPF